jgi:hypothetical protein
LFLLCLLVFLVLFSFGSFVMLNMVRRMAGGMCGCNGLGFTLLGPLNARSWWGWWRRKHNNWHIAWYRWGCDPCRTKACRQRNFFWPRLHWHHLWRNLWRRARHSLRQFFIFWLDCVIACYRFVRWI